MVDLDDPRPAYLQIAAWLRDRIRDGTYQPGDRLPSASALCDRFQVARETVRRALDLLHADGTVVRRQGAGIFVRPRRPNEPRDYDHLARAVRDLHTQSDNGVCVECGRDWPCRTRQLVDSPPG
jgi:DNA-binding GntR family transcriptional regulator